MRVACKLFLLILATLAIGLGATAPAGAVNRSAVAPAAASSDDPVAQASCGPPCAFAAAAAIRGALALRAARAAKAVAAAAAATRAAARNADKVSRVKIRRVQRESKRVSRKGERWLKKNWTTLRYETKVCLSTVAFFESSKYLVDRVLDKDEWAAYSIYGPRLVPASESLQMNFPIRYDAKELASKAGEKAIECAIGLGFQRYYANRGNDNKPK